MTLAIDCDISGALDLLDRIEAAGRDKLARPVAQAGAQVLYDEVKTRVGAIGKKTGNLQSAIYQAFSADNSRAGHAVYHVSWNLKKAPHGRLIEFGHFQYFKSYIGRDGKWYTRKRPGANGRKPSGRASLAEKSAYYDPLPSPKFVAARPFLRPAFEARKAAAREAMLSRLGAELDTLTGRK